MASFTDNPNVLGSFTPYQPEEPVQALIDVGMYKQQEFDQGVQKIQGQVDYLANLPLVKQEHKDYMNQKLGQLKDTVSHSIASDFSDQRLINQIGGLTKRVANDPIIENGVSSTLRMQANDAQMAKDKADGKYNPANEGVYNDDKMSWLNDHDINSQFNASYSTPVDYNKKALDVLKVVTQNPDLKEADIPFQRNADGSYKRDKSGNPVLDEVMVREKYSGVSPNKIQEALMATFDESDINQLNIEGRWHYRGASPQDMYNIYKGRSDSRISSYNAAIDALKTQKLEKGANQDEIQQSIEQYKDLIRQEQTTASSLSLNDIANNLNGFKAKVYTSDYLSTFSKAFSFENKTSQVVDNPYQNYRFKVDTMNREWAQLGETRRHNVADEGLKGKEIELATNRLWWEMNKPGAGTSKNWGQGVTFTGTTPTNISDNSAKTLNDDIATTVQALTGIKNNILSQSADVPGTTPQDRERNLEAIYDDFNKTGKLPQSPDIINYIKQRKMMERDNLSRQKLYKNAEQYATSLAKPTAFGESLNKVISPTGYTTKSYLGDLHFSPLEVKTILGKLATVDEENIASIQGGGSGSTDVTNRLSAKERVFYDRWKSNDRALTPLISFYSKNHSNINTDVDQQTSLSNEDMNNYINTHTNQYATKSGGIPLPKEDVRQTFSADLSALITASGRKDSDSQDMLKWAQDNNSTFNISVAGDNKRILTVNYKGDSKSITLSADETKSFFGSDFSNSFDNVDQTIKRFGSTNFAGIHANPENAYFQTFDMNPTILSDKYSGKVKADIIPIPNTGMYKIKLWYYNPNAKASDKWQSKDIFQKDGNGYNLESSYEYIKTGIGDNTIESIFK